MVNGYSNNYSQVQPQILPAQAQPPQVQAPVQATYAPSPVNPSGVNINIISPSVYGPQNAAPIPYVPIYNYPQAPAPAPLQAAATPVPTPPPPNPVAPVKQVSKNIVPLTDEYVRGLESSLTSPDKLNRILAAKQVMNRFKDNDSRKRDAALTALLNKGLKDESSEVRFVAMSTLAAGYAAGDDKTVSLLTNLHQQTSNYNTDAELAAQALAKMAETQQELNVQLPEN